MRGYLSQIGSEGVADSRSMLRPFIRSRSPISENDQRIGISQWELPVSMESAGSSPTDTEPSDIVSQPLTTDSPRQPSAERQNDAPPMVVCRPKPSPAPTAPAKMAALRSQPASPGVETFPSEVSSRHPISESASEPKANLEPEIPENKIPVIRHPKHESQAVAVLEERTTPEPQSFPQRLIPFVAPSPTRPAVERKQDPPAGSKESAGKALVRELNQPAPARIVAPHMDEPTSPNFARAEPAIPSHEADDGPNLSPRMPAAVAPLDSHPPQVVIDRLEIEVVPPPTAASAKSSGKRDREAGATRPQRPGSQIGPLSQSTALRHYLSLRYR